MKYKRFVYSLFENIVLNLIIFYVFFYINPIKENYLSMNIHPLVIVVTAMALRYGNYIGLTSAFIASVNYVYSYYLLGRDLYLFIIDFNYYKFLLMFFLSAVVFGRFKDNFEFRLNNLRMKYEELKKNYDELKSGYDKMKFIKEELRKQIVGVEYSIVSLYEIASSLETLDSEEIYTEVMNMLSKFLKAKAVSIYTVDDSQKYLRLKLKMGQDILIPNSIVIQEHNCFMEAITTKKPVKVNSECKSSGMCPLLIGPILKDDRAIAVVNIEKIEFEMVTEYSFNLFKVIVDWINRALVQALEVESEFKNKRFFENTNIMKYEYFLERLDEEKARREKFDLDYCLLKYEVKEMNIKEIDDKLQKLIRKVDVVSYDEANNVLYILLPATDNSKLAIVLGRIENAFKERLVRLDDNY